MFFHNLYVIFELYGCKRLFTFIIDKVKGIK